LINRADIKLDGVLHLASELRDALTVRYLSRDIDDGNGVGGAGPDDMKPHLAIGDEDGVAWLQGAQNFRMRKRHPVLIPRRGIRVEKEIGALDELDRPVLKVPMRGLGPWRSRRMPIGVRIVPGRPDHSGLPADLIMRGIADLIMRGINAKEVGAGMKQRRYRCWICGRRSESRNNLAPAQPHFSLVKLDY
jgi:hypothetical protein